MLNINFLPNKKTPHSTIDFVVIGARYKEQWVLCKHKDRNTYEFPGGHVEKNESSETAARRELYEETGAIIYTLTPICIYSIKGYDGLTTHSDTTYGELFYADITFFKHLPNYEIEEISFFKNLPSNCTYAIIQPLLIEQIEKNVSTKCKR